MKGSELTMVRCDIVYPGISIKALTKYIIGLTDADINKSGQFKDAKVISSSENEVCVYVRIPFGLLMSDRAAVTYSLTKNLPDGSQLYLAKNIDHPNFKVPDDCVKMDFWRVSYAVEKDGDLHTIYFEYSDVKTFIPPRIMTMGTGDWKKKELADIYPKLQKIQASL